METTGPLMPGRVRDLVAVADGQLSSKSYEAAIDTFRTALAELSGDAEGAVRAAIETRLAAAQQARDVSQRVAALLAEARFQQTMGRWSEAAAALGHVLQLDPSNQAAARLREQFAGAVPESATPGPAAGAPAPVTVVAPEAPVETVPPSPAVAQPGPSLAPPGPQTRWREKPPAQPKPQTRWAQKPRWRQREADPELSILDPKPRCGPCSRTLTAAMVAAIAGAVAVAISYSGRHASRPSRPAPVSAVTPVAALPATVAPETGVYAARPSDNAMHFAGPGLTMPVLTHKVEPEYTEEARRAKLQGTVALWVEIDRSGTAGNMRVLRGLDMGLTGRAVEAVTKWRFRPGMVSGEPVTVAQQVEVSFKLR